MTIHKVEMQTLTDREEMIHELDLLRYDLEQRYIYQRKTIIEITHDEHLQFKFDNFVEFLKQQGNEITK